ncbi:hypothetical protein ACQ143_05610 [Microbacterium sp. MC2]
MTLTSMEAIDNDGSRSVVNRAMSILGTFQGNRSRQVPLPVMTSIMSKALEPTAYTLERVELPASGH